MPRNVLALLMLAALAGCGEIAATAPVNETSSIASPGGRVPRTCRPVTALATGFGEQHVTELATGNLTRAIDKAKDEMAAGGSKGFSVNGQTVKCVDYIDFGGAIGREHKCHASAQLCGQAG
jgi:hypothetical protein